MRAGALGLASLVLAWATGGALAQAVPSNCQALAGPPARIQLAGFGDPLVGAVRIRYLAHAEFAIETPGGVLAVTDFMGLLGNPEVVPDLVTMNHAHETHFTPRPDPRIPLVVRGWPQAGVPAFVDLEIGDLRLRNVTSDIRGPFGEGAERDGNSIFLFEAAGLCIAHMGHLHQELSALQRASIGRVDVLILPIDGGYTMSQAAMARVARDLRARVVLPMHWFTEASKLEFLGLMAADFDLVEAPGPEIELSPQTLPATPTLVLLEPALIP